MSIDRTSTDLHCQVCDGDLEHSDNESDGCTVQVFICVDCGVEHDIDTSTDCLIHCWN